MEKKFITKEEREKVSNRLVLNFGILLAGALLMLYVYNFTAAGYIGQVQNVLFVLSIVFLIAAALAFILGYKKLPSLKKYRTLFLGIFVGCAIVSSTKFIQAFPIKASILAVFVLMAVYFIVIAIYTAIYLKTHTVIIEKKKIQHKKKRK